MEIASTAKRSYWFLVKHVILLQILFTVSTTVVAEQRIVNGSTVNPPHKYPFMVSILDNGCPSPEEDEQGNETLECYPYHRCGGSVLNKHWVVTAAHCLFLYNGDTKPSVERLHVITGLHDREKIEPWSQNLTIAEYVIHESFEDENQNRSGTLNDIALLRVNGTILFGDKVTPINLPSCDFDVKKDGEISGTTLGWGQNRTYNAFPFPRELQEAEQPLLTLETCQRRWGVFELVRGRPGNETRVNVSNAVTDSMVCTDGFDGAGPCFFDSGGPLVVLDKETQTYTQVGIFVLTSGTCGRAGYGGVYTRISKYLNWINSRIQRCYPRSTKH